MKAGRKKQLLTEKEAEIMNMLWDNGPMFIREIVELYPDPKPPQCDAQSQIQHKVNK